MELVPRCDQRLTLPGEATQPDTSQDRGGTGVDPGHRERLGLVVENDVANPRQASATSVVDLVVKDVAPEEKLDLVGVSRIGRDDLHAVHVHRDSREYGRTTFADRDACDAGHRGVEPDTEVSEPAKRPSARIGHASSHQIREEKRARGVARERLRSRRG
jgi:hypothetical protein